jgi:hypothetical protein
VDGCATPLKFEYDVQSVDDTLYNLLVWTVWRGGCFGGTHGNVTQDGQQDVDEEISIAAALEEDTQRWEEDGKDDLANVAEAMLAYCKKLSLRRAGIRCGERHVGGCCLFDGEEWMCLMVRGCDFRDVDV